MPSKVNGNKVHGSLALELFGANKTMMKNEKHPLWLMKGYLSDMDKRRGKNKMDYIGFKWKPYVIGDPKYDEVYKYARDNKFVFLWMERNPLDQLLSRSKHSGSDAVARAHCYNKKCQKEHLDAKVKVDVDDMLKSLKRSANSREQIRKELERLSVKYTHIDYDLLAFGTKKEKADIVTTILATLYPNEKTRVQESEKKKLAYLKTDELITTNRDHRSYVLFYLLLYCSSFSSICDVSFSLDLSLPACIL